MKTKNEKIIDTIFAVIGGAIAVLAIKSIFESDDSKIVSKEGRKVLLDKSKMRKIDQKINLSEEKKTHNEIFI